MFRLGKLLRLEDFDTKYRAAAFSTDGLTLCIWRTDEGTGMHCWYFYAVTDTDCQYKHRKYIARPLQTSGPAANSGQDFLLVPFQEKKCFLACDRSGQVYYLNIGAPDKVQQDSNQCAGAYMALPCAEGSVTLLRKVDGIRLSDVAMAVSSLQGSRPCVNLQAKWSTLQIQEHGKNCGATTFSHNSSIALLASYLDGTIIRQTA